MPLPLRFLHILKAASDHCIDVESWSIHPVYLINSKIDCQGSCHTHATSRASKEVRSSLFCIHTRKKRGNIFTWKKACTLFPCFRILLEWNFQNFLFQQVRSKQGACWEVCMKSNEIRIASRCWSMTQRKDEYETSRTTVLCWVPLSC